LSRGFDPISTNGKRLAPRECVQLLVVGAGPAGCAAAIEAAQLGLEVVLVDENPVDPASMGLEVPFHFGGRMTGAVRNRNAITEAIVANDPALGEAFEAGVDVRLDVAVWTLVAPRPGVAWVGRRAAGLTDGAESWFCGFDAAILATGRRDVGVAFPGWNLPGVMGATAAYHLLRRYDALEGQTFVILGSGAEATALAEALQSAGRTVAAIVEAASEPIDSAGCARLAASGVKVLAGSMIRRALGGDGVEGASIIRLDDAQSETTIACDTIMLATGAAPVIELFDIAGAAIVFRPESGGHVPLVDADGRTTEPMLFGTGDCIGIKADPADRAAAKGVRAARAAAAALAAGPDAGWPKPVIEAMPAEQAPSPRLVWARATRSVAEADTHVCQCEEVSLDDLLGVRPPRYLNRDQPTQKARDLASLANEGRINQDQIKRLTRAGMGLCQGRRCREQVGAALAEATGVALSAIPLPSYRAPVRPLPLATLADESEQPAIAEHWDTWFGIESQWIPFWVPLPAVDEESDR
jgi:pyruvate/2-oxoglutarate dehydrogenase complex dihydrolipoamide dehydrogenase (E3) component